MRAKKLLSMLLLAAAGCSGDPNPRGEGVLSLSPGMTETVVAIGAQSRLVGRSDYCDYPPSIQSLPTAGTSLAPQFEAVARLSPGLILVEANQTAHGPELARLGRVMELPWLTLEDVVAGTRALGRELDAVAAADALASSLQRSLGVAPPDHGPAVLLTLGAVVDGSPIWFIRRNSLHGAALHAAGARNAVERDVMGNASLSIEALLELDPPVIVALLPDSDDAELDRAAVVDAYSRLETLSAVRNARVGAVFGGGYLRTGPRVLDLVDRIAEELERMGVAR